jgi:hypothetical protein
MNIIFRETYWGALIILAGILLIIRNVFKLDIPVMGIIFPIFIITLGVSLLVGFRGAGRHGRNILFSEGDFDTIHSEEHYSVVFGKGSYDLRNLKPVDKDISVDISCSFGSAEVLINPQIPMKMKISSAFGGGHLPNGNTVAFGERIYTTEAYKDGIPSVKVRASVAFGGIEVREIRDSTTVTN